ncbi:MAG TPA: zinc ABC transporter substrate-binding protein [Thiobacillus sp.]|jgi:zinc/manganese transport system substrate-binding protein|nr:zinc ABC transporter substrate-binding protein [Gammaproteobacteria bacterium]OYZ29783.1 MAG: zinc ABC transporter substrate-binding protein [Hydrogenophilales bacterium 16-64-40]OZA35678.1 MAG: zinc ABC transporter substrate-binding protein [Hydrogenophilales bacterium 17-64-65]HQS82317.1 zinc ABC transporter substrate-binding protein [Thiobacillus sp.]HQT34125.1 zinc ABC transporter substrate-binding protein [Thiobacillus sp.]
MKRLLVLLILWLPVYAHAALNVFACEPEWAALAKEIGGGDVKVYSATTAMQDPHRIEARPSLIAQMRRANLVVCTGADLEVGWLPVLLQNANNAAVQPGRPGYFEAARFVPLLDKPARLDRADGDVHAAGNPHLHTDPRNILRVAEALTARLAEVDPANAAAHRARGQAFAARWQAAITRWETRAAPLKNLPVAVQHKSFSYLLAWLGLREVAVLEPRPGVEPSVSHLARVAAQLQATPARAVLRAAYQSPRPADWLASRTGIPALALPYTVGGNARAQDLFGLFDDTLDQLLKAAP